MSAEIVPEEIEKLYKKLDAEAAAGGYHLNPDRDHTRGLVEGILKNQKRYGYWICPCRLAEGVKEKDLDIICPCDYRDADLNEYGTCYCGLYVSESFLDGKTKVSSIPERRPDKEEERQKGLTAETRLPSGKFGKTPVPVWRCRVCGYLCARDEPPEVCPICKAKKDRFEKFTS